MSSKKQKKGKTMSLTDYLANEPKLITVRGTNWSEIVDREEEETGPIVVDLGALPIAPRNAVDVDYSTVPTNPPFVAYVANLSFEIADENLRRIFAGLNPKSARVIRDGGRSRGVGLVEFETRENLIEALKKSDKEVYGRRIRVNVSDKTESQMDGARGLPGKNRSTRGIGEERPEMADRWTRAEPRSDETSDDRFGNGINRDRQNRGHFGPSNTGNSSRDNQQRTDYGYGYRRLRDERGGGTGNRDHNRQGQRYYQDDANRSNSGMDRPRYAGRYSDTRDTRDRRAYDEPHDDQPGPPRERPRLQLQPRTKRPEEYQQLSVSSSSVHDVASDVGQSSTSNLDDVLSSATNKSDQQEVSSEKENQDEHRREGSQDTNDDASQVKTSEDRSAIKLSRGAGASIFGGAKPVDTAAREFEIERKLQELQMSARDTFDENEDRVSSSRLAYNRSSERDAYRNKRSSQMDDRRHRKDGRLGYSGDYHHKREYGDNRQIEDDGQKRNNDHYRRVGGIGYDRDRYSGSSRHDYESGRRNNAPGNYRLRDNRNYDINETNNSGRSTNNNYNSESQTRNQQRGMTRPTFQTEDNSTRLQLSNKFDMLDDDNLDDFNESDDGQNPSTDD